MARIPHIAHFTFGLRPQLEPFHLLHYLAVESCRSVLRPEKIYCYYHHLPYGVFWDTIRPHLTLVHVDLVRDVEAAEYDERLVPEEYRYAHHADFIRLDALIEHGGIYADIDTLFLRPFPDELYSKPFVIGREGSVTDEITGEARPSLCNAILMAPPASDFARAWRERMGSALNGTWSNHSGFLAQALSEELPDSVHVEPVESFFAVPSTPAGLKALFDDGDLDLDRSYSVHLWAHLWWSPERTDFSERHALELTLPYLRSANSPLGRLARPFLPTLDVDDLRG